MVIEFETEAEFARLLEALAQELVDANIHWKLYNDLTRNHDEFAREYSQSWTFWSLTFQAHIDATIFRLIRIYDVNRGSLSLRNLLDTISANLCVFQTENFRERLKGNPFVDSLAEEVRIPDEDQLREDIQFVSKESNPVVENLTILRNNLFAHRNAKNEVEGYRIASDYPLPLEEIEQLASTGMNILNRYVTLFRASSYSTKIIGDDDYQSVLKSIRVHLGHMNKELEEERAMFEAMSKERL